MLSLMSRLITYYMRQGGLQNDINSTWRFCNVVIGYFEALAVVASCMSLTKLQVRLFGLHFSYIYSLRLVTNARLR
jgi:hypothetical protein